MDITYNSVLSGKPGSFMLAYGFPPFYSVKLCAKNSRLIDFVSKYFIIKFVVFKTSIIFALQLLQIVARKGIISSHIGFLSHTFKNIFSKTTFKREKNLKSNKKTFKHIIFRLPFFLPRKQLKSSSKQSHNNLPASVYFSKDHKLN